MIQLGPPVHYWLNLLTCSVTCDEMAASRLAVYSVFNLRSCWRVNQNYMLSAGLVVTGGNYCLFYTQLKSKYRERATHKKVFIQYILTRNYNTLFSLWPSFVNSLTINFPTCIHNLFGVLLPIIGSVIMNV